MKLAKLCGIVMAILFWQCTPATAIELTVNFDPGGTPNIPLGPDTFAAAGPMQTITVPSQVTITGGVVLGMPLNFPAITFATPPNVYGTANVVGADASLQNVITITIDPSFSVTEVGGILANGTGPISYVVTAFSGATIVDTDTFLNMPSNGDLGFGLFDSLNNPITSVTIAPLTLGGTWDFFIDTLTFNHPVPEPSTLALAALGAVGLGWRAWRRKRTGHRAV